MTQWVGAIRWLNESLQEFGSSAICYDVQVSIDCLVAPSAVSARYNRATATFRQLADNGRIYGLKFANAEDALRFDDAMVPLAASSPAGSNGKHYCEFIYLHKERQTIGCSTAANFLPISPTGCFVPYFQRQISVTDSAAGDRSMRVRKCLHLRHRAKLKQAAYPLDHCRCL